MSYIGFVCFCRKYFLKVKEEDFLFVLKMVLLWTLLHGIIVFLRKMFHFLNIEVVLH